MNRALRSLVSVAVVVALVVVVFWAVGRDQDDDSAGPGTSQSSPRTERTVPPVPEGAPAEGMYVQSELTDDGEVRVQTWLRVPQPLEQLQLTTTDPDLLPGSVESLDLVVRTLDGTVLARRDSVGTNPQTIRLRQPAAELYFSYTIDGALDDALASVEGRGLVRVLGMDVDHAGAAGPVVRLVQTPGTVLSVGCLRPTEDFTADPRPCGRPSGDGDWLVELEGPDRGDRLLASYES